FNVPQEAGSATANIEEGQKAEGTGESTNAEGTPNTNANTNTSNAARFPPMYPLVYPPVNNEQKGGA
ncbi:hypothetical protein FS749_008588, partial [Ceratobasidium sp. UAMH 11750]